MTREEIEELKGLAASMGLYDDKNPCKRAVILGKAIEALEQEPCDTLKLDGMLEDAYEHGYEQARHDFEVQPCEDCVSRQAVIAGIREYWHDEYYQRVPITEEREDLINDVINHLPPVTPKPTECEDAVSREAMLNGLVSIAKAKARSDAQKSLMGRVMFFTEQLPPVTPKQRWIPIKTRPMTEEEAEHYFEYIDQRVDAAYTILDCPLPEDGQEVLVSCGNNVCVDIFAHDIEGCYFEDRDIDEVTAWMPLPEPYREVKE